MTNPIKDPRFRDRPTADLIIIALTGVVSVIMLVSIAGLVLIEIFVPDTDISDLAQRVGTLTSSLIGAIVGYVAGRNSPTNNNH